MVAHAAQDGRSCAPQAPLSAQAVADGTNTLAIRHRPPLQSTPILTAQGPESSPTDFDLPPHAPSRATPSTLRATACTTNRSKLLGTEEARRCGLSAAQ